MKSVSLDFTKKISTYLSFVILSFAYSLEARSQYNSYKNKSIEFVENLSWNEAKAVAKREGKYIFLDCYASWCGPCKAMELNVYNRDTVANFINRYFVSVKIQIDKTERDKESVKMLYKDADSIKRSFEVNAFPTFLFFSPEGELVHKGLGYKTPGDFIQLAFEAINPASQYFSLRSKYISNQLEKSSLKKLALYAKENGNDSFALVVANDYLKSISDSQKYSKENILFITKFSKSPIAQEIAKIYKQNFLDTLCKKGVVNKDDWEFVFSFSYLLSSSDPFFKSLYWYESRTDSINGKGTSKKWVKYIINKEEIQSYISRREQGSIKESEWAYIAQVIIDKYGKEYADELILDAKKKYYRKIKDWSKYVEVLERLIGNYKKINQVKLHPWGNSYILNEWAWDLFLHCDSRSVLRKALKWSELSIKNESNPLNYVTYIDTKANLLYRLGCVQKAIYLQKSAIQIDKDNARHSGKLNGSYYEQFRANLEKMKKGVPTWEM